uniref:Oxysterol-binding protein n=1 Tax=Astatotilapia calliptera TaxID=8154 RepID=A0AAX7V3R5_ASTCA
MTSTSPTHSDSSGSSKHDGSQDNWEIVEGLRGVPASMQEPEKQGGFLLKRRKWPMKGWHKRYFLLEKGIMRYAKRESDISKGKLHGCIDVGLSVMSIKKKAMCIDLDTEDNIYHLKVKSPELFEEWVSKLRHHRLFRQNEISMYPHEKHLFHPHATSSPSLNESLRKQASIHQSKINSWLHSSDDMDKCCKDLEDCESYLLELNLLLKSMEVLHRTYSAPVISGLQVSTGTRIKLPLVVLYNNQLTPGQILWSCGITPQILTIPDKWSDYTHLVSFYPIQDSVDAPQSLVHQVSSESKGSESLTEFFDAQEYLLSSSSSENEVRHHLQDQLHLHVQNAINDQLIHSNVVPTQKVCSVVTLARRRSTLPSPCPANSVSLWNILRNNIGKDLSKVAMPVHLNEPLNTLQKLCEELEYSELLDTANQTQDPYQRMVYVATFAISSYASTYYRAGSKPFNPVLGETYECDRPDKGFRFIAEQVSHHPPVSACHADSKNFTFWQDVRWKNKFWGKSMEIVPMGTTRVTLPAFGDHYEWNKVTSCIHNILSGQRWIEHYGEMAIKNINSNVCQCKITFVKARTWSSTVNEIEGVVTDSDGKVVHSIFGKWNEAVFQGKPPSATCIWRANPMPVDQEQYYGFTQFAVELNELDLALRPLLPPSDTRFRPDQRLLLEEGNVDGAEEQKQRIEQLQRERRKVLQDNNMTHQPRFFKKSKDDTWVSNNTYWEMRRDPGFSKMDFPVLW